MKLMRTAEEAEQRRVLQALREEMTTALNKWEEEIRNASGRCVDIIAGRRGTLSKAVYLLKYDALSKEKLQLMIEQCKSFETRMSILPRVARRDLPPQAPLFFLGVTDVTARIYRSRSVRKLSVAQARARAKALGTRLLDEPAEYYLARPSVEDCHLQVIGAGDPVTVRGGEFAWVVCVGKPILPLPKFQRLPVIEKDVLKRSRFGEPPRLVGEVDGTTLFAINPGTDRLVESCSDENW